MSEAGSRYRAYPEYKESEIEWLGSIPKPWGVYAGKRIFKNERKPALTSDQQLAASQKYGVIPQTLMMKLNDSKVMLALKGTQSFRHVDENNFVISLRSFEGGIEHSSYSGCVSPAYTVLSSSKAIFHFYFKYLLKCAPFVSALEASTDSLRDGKSITYDQFGTIHLPTPSYNEQVKIASFLDHETAKIDTLIEEQKTLIRLLKEKRQAVISHAVTKGLNPDVKVKDSGVEWLGEVPEHWEVSSLRHYADFVDGDRGSQYPNENDLKNSGVLFLSSKNIVECKLDLTEAKFISQNKFDQLNRGKALDGDLIVKVRGSVGRIGELAKFSISEHKHKTAFINAQMMIIRTSNKMLPDYLVLVSQSLYWTEQLAVGAYGTAQQQLSNDIFANLHIAVPPIEEQITILEKLDEVCASLNHLIHEGKTAIKLMQERRTALISAAVTGKIDVRDWSPADNGQLPTANSEQKQPEASL